MKRSLLVLLALASSGAFALSEADITFNSPCGADGVGKQYSPANGRAEGEIHFREGVPGKRVGPDGFWESGCVMPRPKRDCPETAVDPWRGKDGWGYCVPAKHSLLREQIVGRKWGVATSPSTTLGRGSQVWECTRLPDGSAAWVLVRSSCSPK